MCKNIKYLQNSAKKIGKMRSSCIFLLQREEKFSNLQSAGGGERLPPPDEARNPEE